MHVGAHVQSITEVNQFQQNDAFLQIQQLQTSQALNRWRFPPPHPPNTGESPPGYELIHIWGGEVGGTGVHIQSCGHQTVGWLFWDPQGL